MSTINTLSASSIRTYDACQYKFKLSYIDKIPSPVKGNVYTAFGRSIHTCAQNFYKLKDRSEARLLRFFEPFFRAELKEAEVVLSESDHAKYKKRAQKCIKNFYKAATTEDCFKTPLGTELKFKVPYNNIKLIGYIDFLSEENSGIIIDYKTGKNMPTAENLKTDVQLSIYGFAAIKYFNLPNPKLCLFYLDLNKKLFTERSDAQYEALFSKIDSILKHVKTDAFFEPNTNHCRWCEYSEMCKYSSNKKYYLKMS